MRARINVMLFTKVMWGFFGLAIYMAYAVKVGGGLTIDEYSYIVLGLYGCGLALFFTTRLLLKSGGNE